MDLLIVETNNTPQISFKSSINEYIISGRSYPKEANSFYEPVLKWLNSFENMGIVKCNFQFKLEFFNTSSSKVLLEILLKLKEIIEHCKTQLSVTWFFEEDDEDMKETGEMLMELSKLPLEFVSYKI